MVIEVVEVTATQITVAEVAPNPITVVGITPNPITVVEVTKTGQQGVEGPQGVDGLSAYQVAVNNGYTGTEQQWVNSFIPVAYVHTQSSASNLWTINHNLGIKPSIYIYSDGGLKMEGDVLPTTSLNQVQIAFTLPVSGSARLT